jgi:hypothetical protein
LAANNVVVVVPRAVFLACIAVAVLLAASSQ